MAANGKFEVGTERRTKGSRRRRRDRWAARVRPIMYGFAIDAIIFAVLFVTQRRTREGLSVLSRRLRGEPEVDAACLFWAPRVPIL